MIKIMELQLIMYIILSIAIACLIFLPFKLKTKDIKEKMVSFWYSYDNYGVKDYYNHIKVYDENVKNDNNYTKEGWLFHISIIQDRNMFAANSDNCYHNYIVPNNNKNNLFCINCGDVKSINVNINYCLHD